MNNENFVSRTINLPQKEENSWHDLAYVSAFFKRLVADKLRTE